MKIYIAGKITGDPEYRRKFACAARQVEALGHIALNPAELPEGMTAADYMRICFAMIDVADCVIFLPDAGDSAGAQIERAYCEYIGKRMVHELGELTKKGGSHEGKAGDAGAGELPTGRVRVCIAQRGGVPALRL